MALKLFVIVTIITTIIVPHNSNEDHYLTNYIWIYGIYPTLKWFGFGPIRWRYPIVTGPYSTPFWLSPFLLSPFLAVDQLLFRWINFDPCGEIKQLIFLPDLWVHSRGIYYSENRNQTFYFKASKRPIFYISERSHRKITQVRLHMTFDLVWPQMRRAHSFFQGHSKSTDF